MAEFNANWYKKFIESSNEKKLLVKKILDLLDGKPKNSCLEIGLGISPYFAKELTNLFNRYVIIERKIFNGEIPAGIKLIEADWENVEMDEKFDVIIASHVACYFRDKEKAVGKMLNSLNPNGRIFLVVNGTAKS
jgi:SAM-dependent methyltransferase